MSKTTTPPDHVSTAEAPVTFQFADISQTTADAFERWCSIRDKEISLASDKERTRRSSIEHDQEMQRAEARRKDRAAEAVALVAMAEADAKVEGIKLALSMHRAKVDLEIRKIKIEGDVAEQTAQFENVSKVLDLVWPKAEALGKGFVALCREEGDRRISLIKEELRLVAGRHPVDGSK